MRIMIVTDQYPPMVGGVPRVTHGLAVDFVQRGHQVWVVAPSYGARDIRRVEQDIHVFRFSSFEWPTYKDLRIPFLPLLPVRNLIKRSDPDIIHIHSPVVLGNIAQIFAGGLHKPVIATNHYLPINMSRSLMADPVIGRSFSTISYSYLVNFCNHCEYVTAPTQTALDLLYEHGLHAPAAPISNGIDLQLFSPGPANPEVLYRFNLAPDRPIVLHVNRLSEEKRVDVLVDAAVKMQHQAQIVLVGTGPMEVELREQVERLGIADRVHFLGFVRDEDLLVLRQSATVFAIPSEADLQSLATMEAMACGLPVVAANSYALPELVHHEKNGFLFQPGDSAEMAEQLDKLLQDQALRAQMGAESLRIIAGHDRIKVLDQWEDLYRRLSIEFKEAKENRVRMRIAHKYPGYSKQETMQTKRPRARLLHSSNPMADQQDLGMTNPYKRAGSVQRKQKTKE
jgi:phosphatidylinositol alpha 1,6-mannosyltransferase